jgi:VIT1/CCC1 family predicted Fe2+/Mn2+ transporter
MGMPTPEEFDQFGKKLTAGCCASIIVTGFFVFIFGIAVGRYLVS